MEIFYFTTGFIFLLLDFLWRLNINVFQQKITSFIGRFLLGVSFFGAYHFAMFKYLWLTLSISCFVSWIFWLLFIIINRNNLAGLKKQELSMQSENSHSEESNLEEDKLDSNLIQIYNYFLIFLSGMLVILWVSAWQKVIY